MSAKPTATRLKLSKDLLGRLFRLIRASAEKLAKARGETYDHHGLPNALIVNAVLDEAVGYCEAEFRSVIAALLAQLVPTVLGRNKGDDEPAFAPQTILPGLYIPRWLAVPPDENDEQGQDGWKLSRDVTPNELTRIIEAREQDILGRIVEKGKLVLARDTALDLGCDPNEPISTVIDDDEGPSPPSDVDGPRPSL